MGKFKGYQQEVRLQSLSLTLIKTKAEFLKNYYDDLGYKGRESIYYQVLARYLLQSLVSDRTG